MLLYLEDCLARKNTRCYMGFMSQNSRAKSNRFDLKKYSQLFSDYFENTENLTGKLTIIRA